MAGSLVATHNLRRQRLMLDIRRAIRDNDWSAFRAGWPELGPISPHCLDRLGAHFMPVFAQPLSILLLAQETLPAASGAGAGDVAARRWG